MNLAKHLFRNPRNPSPGLIGWDEYIEKNFLVDGTIELATVLRCGSFLIVPSRNGADWGENWRHEMTDQIENDDATESKRPRLITVANDNGVLTFTVAGAGDIRLDTNALSPDVRDHATIHGFVQKVSDAAALGKDADATDKLAAMQAVADRLVAGDWNKGRGDGTGQPSGLIARAVAEHTGKDVVSVREWLGGKTRSEVLALRSVPAIREIMDRIRSETGAVKAVDADALLAGLMD